MSIKYLAALSAFAFTLTSCSSNGDRAGTASASTTPPPEHVDSVVPRDTAIARFQATAKPVTSLSGGFTSRDALVRAYAKALATHDSAAFAKLGVTRDEFAYLYYPTTPQGLPPYDLAPGLMWFMMETNSRKGLLHALEERSGQMKTYQGYTCPDLASHEGENTVWGPCLVKYEQKPGDVVSERLFSQIIERGGVYKILSFSNKL